MTDCRRASRCTGSTRRWFGLAALLLFGPTCAWAADEELPKITAMRIGFAGRYKLGAWTPLEVTLEGGLRPAIGSVSVIVPDGDDTPSRFSTLPGRPVQVLPGSSTRVVLYVKPGRQIESLEVTFRREDGRKVEQTLNSFQARNQGQDWPLALGVEDRFCLVLGSWIAIPHESGKPGAWTQVVLKDLADLPTHWYGYDAVDTLVITTSRPEVFSSLRPESAQLAAIEQWVAQGGRLVLSVGAEARAVLDPKLALARLAPGALADVVTIRRGDGLEKFATTSSAPVRHIPFAGRAEEAGIPVARLDKLAGVVLAEEGNLPLVVRTPRGFGEITFAAIDLDRRPLADWPSRTALVERLLRTDEAADAQAHVGNAANVGFTDLAGQLRGALDQFSGVRLVPFWIVGTLVFAYILLIGPVDFWLVKKVFKRMELTWLTFPTIVVTVSLAAYLAAYWTKGSKLLLNQVDLVDVENSSGQLRGTSWLNVFSPTTSTYDLTLATPLPSPAPPDGSGLLFSWLGLPGNAWGGMQAAHAGPRLFEEPYQVAPHLDALSDVPIDVWSTKGFIGRWHGSSDPLVESNLAGAAGEAPEGTVTSRLKFPLTDCLLVSGRWAFPLGELSPGASVKIDAADKRELDSALREFSIEKNPKNATFTRRAIPYDWQGLDVPPIMQAMMFHESVRRWTGLSNHYQSFVDLSSHLRLNQAILVGQAPSDQYPARLVRDGAPLPADRHWVFYRFLLPVAAGE